MNITSALSLLEVAKLGGKALSYVFGSDTDSAARGTSTDFAKLLAQRTEGLGLDGRNPALRTRKGSQGRVGVFDGTLVCPRLAGSDR